MPNSVSLKKFNFVNLNAKTTYSFLQSLLKVEDLVFFSKEHKMAYACIMDVNVMYGVMPFYFLCLKNQIKPIVGFELKNESYHALLIALNYNGYKNLVKICSFNALNQAFVLTDYLEDIAVVDYLENIKIESSFLFTVNEQAKNYLAVNNAYYLTAQDYSSTCLLKAIADANTVADEGLKTILLNKPAGLDYLISSEEANQRFNQTGLKNLSDLLEKINLVIPFNEKYLMQVKYPEPYKDAKTYLQTLAIEGLKQRFQTNMFNVKYIERLKMELKVIDQLGFNDYFLVVHEYVKWAKQNHISVGPGRGSAVGSLVSYALDITSIDPLQYDLYFERFLNPARTSMPDIDIDFSDTKRQMVIDHLFDYYNYDTKHRYRISYLITFQTIKLRTAIRDVGRVLNINPTLIDQISKSISLKYDESNPQAELQKAVKKEVWNQYHLLFEYVLKIVGLYRQYSMHAAGVVMSNVNMYNVIPIQKGNNNLVVTQYSMEYLEQLGLLKMDLLGLNNLTLLEDILSFIRKQTNEEIDIEKISLFDPAVYNMLSNGLTFGIFQFESPGMTHLLKRVQPVNLEDLAMTSAMFRPGPQAQIEEWIKRRNNPSLITPLVPQLKGVLDNTCGLLVYQEQVMQIAQVLAGFTLTQADLLRRAISKKHANELIQLKQQFLDGCIKNHIDIKDANMVYDYIFEFASYGFNKSHAIAYAYLSYWLGYLKVHYPLQFLEGYLTSKSYKDNQKLITEFCIQAQIELFAPDILNSDFNFSINLKERKLYFGFDGVKGIGAASIEKMQTLKKIAHECVANVHLCLLKSYQIVSKKTLESLILAGCYDSLDQDRNKLLKILSVVDEIGKVLKEHHNENDLLNLLQMKLQIVQYKPLSDLDLLKNEILILGYDKTSLRFNQTISKVATNSNSNLNWEENETKTFDHVILVSYTQKTAKNGKNYLSCSLQINKQQVINATIPYWKVKKYLEMNDFFIERQSYCVQIKKAGNFFNIEQMNKE